MSDELEQLRHNVEYHKGVACMVSADAVLALFAEIERLRAAITLALDTMHPQGYLQSGAVKALRAALSDTGGEG